MTDVARLARTTVATVSRVINNNGYVSASLRSRVVAAVEEIGYVPNANARTLRTKRSRTIGIVVGDLTNPYSMELASAVTGAAVGFGYTTFIATATDDVDSDVAVIDAFHRQRVDGLVIATLRTENSDAALLRLADRGMPLVLVGRDLEHEFVDSIGADFRAGGRLATKHLLDLGHRRVAFVGANLADAKRVTRLQGYVDALEEAGLRIRPEYVLGAPGRAASPRYSGHGTGHQATLQLLRIPTPPTAIFARNDHTAFGVLQALSENGISVPGEMSVMGFDDIPIASRVVPTVSSVRQPTQSQGKAAVDYLLARIERPDEGTEARRLVLDCTLMARQSSAALREPKSKAKSATRRGSTKK